MEKTYENAIELLTSQGKFYINLGLERISQILGLMGNPQKNLKCIHVAGTNGKGSTCAILSTILTQTGAKTGLFTSPHLFEYTERIKIDGVQISKEVFAKKIFEVQNLAEKHGIHLTEFEILTAVMFEYFAENNLEYVVLETGLGGRFDATNVVENPICTIITHIDFDHTERLGDTIEKIAYEKAGIIKPFSPTVIFKDNIGFEVIKQIAGKNLVLASGFNFKELSLKGKYQQENLSLALSALNTFLPDIKIETIIEAIQKVNHPCRFQYFEKENLIIDGAHNPNGVKSLRESLESYFPNNHFRFIFGCLKNKDYKTMIKSLFKSEDEIYFYHFNYPNACDYEDLKSSCEYETKEFIGEITFDETPTVICGSLYMIKELVGRLF